MPDALDKDNPQVIASYVAWYFNHATRLENGTYQIPDAVKLYSVREVATAMKRMAKKSAVPKTAPWYSQ